MLSKKPVSRKHPEGKLKPAKEGDSRGMGSKKESEDESTRLVNESGSHRVDYQHALNLRKVVLALSGLTVVSLLCISITALIQAVKTSSNSMLALGLETMLDSVTSCVVIWRFSSKEAMYSDSKERAACLCLGFMCLLIDVVLIVRSSLSLSKQEEVTREVSLLYTFSVSIVACISLAIAKFYIAFKLESISIATDAMTSGLGALLSLSCIATYFVDESLWFLDGVLGLVASALLAIYGVAIIIYELQKGQSGSPKS